MGWIEGSSKICSIQFVFNIACKLISIVVIILDNLANFKPDSDYNFRGVINFSMLVASYTENIHFGCKTEPVQVFQ